MWEYNQIHGNAKSSALMHKDHKYVDKYRNSKGNWQYVYETTKKGAKAVANGVSKASKFIKDTKAAGHGYGQMYSKTMDQIGNAPKNLSDKKTAEANAKEREQRAATQKTLLSTQQALKEDRAKKENQSAKNEIKGTLMAMKSYENIYKMISNATDFPVNYKDPKNGRSVSISNERAKGMALKQIAGNMDSMAQTINEDMAGMNPDDPEMSKYVQTAQTYLDQYKKNLSNSKIPSRPSKQS